MNDFVNYLNSTNNVGGNSTGSLAETQVKSVFYDSVKVDRKLGSYITSCVESGNHKAFILTGHAGDGKTSILVQVLKSLGRISNGESLCIYKEYSDFLYYKDMSEIAAEKQAEALRNAISAPDHGKTSLLISNTGPLLKAFESLVAQKKAEQAIPFSTEDRIVLQSTLLTQLDINNDEPLCIEGYEFILVNIARVDNVPFAVSIMKNIIAPPLWTSCDSCSCSERCPIKNNYNLVTAHFERIAAFVENYYRYLYENDKRMTIRQMIGQISYAITGNLNCRYIESRHLKEPYFVYNFANLFFGYTGLKPAKDAAQIKGIEQIQTLELDRIALESDYDLFVRHDFTRFTPALQKELIALTQRYRKHYQIVDEDRPLDEKEQVADLRLRRAIRRFYLLFSLCESENDLDKIMNQVFGEAYTDYKNLISSKQSKMLLKKMQAIVFNALYMKNTGYLPEGKNELPLTLRREDDVFQNVMIVLGEVGKNNLEIVQKNSVNHFEDVNEKYELYLKLNDKLFKLTLPMITYFMDLIAGAISSNNNPALTHGIAQLDALLLDQYGEEIPECQEDCELSVIINTAHGQEVELFAFDSNHLSIQ